MALFPQTIGGGHAVFHAKLSIDALKKHDPRITVPVLVMHSEDDLSRIPKISRPLG